MLCGPADNETVQGFQFHAPPGHQIVMQGGEASRLYGLRQGQGRVLWENRLDLRLSWMTPTNN